MFLCLNEIDPNVFTCEKQKVGQIQNKINNNKLAVFTKLNMFDQIRKYFVLY